MRPTWHTILLLVLVFVLTACAAPLTLPTLPPPASPRVTGIPSPVVTTAAPNTPMPIPSVPIVTTQSGQLQGVIENQLVVFKGIPYAAPPVGELRWREPQPVAAWDGVRQAFAFDNACIQPGSSQAGDVGPQSEDCLYLNVWTPSPIPLANLPVMVWIHGGALINGAGSLPLYDGSSLSKRGAVVVTINYRLGALGFFSHPALDQANPGGPVNYGLLDEIAALKWVQQNIFAFGGDPSNVMIFGESAGGQSVLALFASPLARGLFAQGVAESPYGIPSHTRAKALEAGSKFADAAGLDGANATLAELRAIPADKFPALNTKDITLAPSFIAGDAALPERLVDIFLKGNEAPVPLIIGSNSDEATVAILFGIDPAKLIEKMGIAKIALKPLYPGVTDNNELGRQLIRDLIFTAFVKRIADLHAQRAPSWRYYFTYVPVNLRDKEPGVPHGGEIVFVMGTGDLAPQYKAIFTDADREMSKRVGDYWFQFARTSKPNPQGEPAWDQASRTSDKTMEFGETIVLQSNMMKARLDVFIDLVSVLGKFLDREQ